MNSALYVGRVMHSRMQPAAHRFSYRSFMMYIDLAELPTLFDRFWCWSSQRPALAQFRRSDYLDPTTPSLSDAVRNLVLQKTGVRPSGPIRLLTHLRYFGHNFSPVTFYYVFNHDGSAVETIVAEITNTPWKERHAYVLPVAECTTGGQLQWQFAKRFHVSPFMQMDQHYAWQFNTPGERLAVHMTNYEQGEQRFAATLTLSRQPITSANLAMALLRFPAMTVQVLTAIHWQALRLWLKRVPVVDHPRKAAR
jgi:uncharacterized protein